MNKHEPILFTNLARGVTYMMAAEDHEQRARVLAEYVLTFADGDIEYGKEIAADLARQTLDAMISLKKTEDITFFCQNCHDIFLKKRPDQKFCSHECRVKYYYFVQQKAKDEQLAIMKRRRDAAQKEIGMYPELGNYKK